MGAGHWTKCPACIRNYAKKRDEAIANVKARYGKIDADAFVAALAEAEAMPAEPNGAQLAEYFLASIDDDGVFGASYRANCHECNASFEFDHASDKPVI